MARGIESWMGNGNTVRPVPDSLPCTVCNYGSIGIEGERKIREIPFPHM